MLLEFFSDLHWNAPNDFYEIVRSQKISANLPEALNFFAGNSFLDINSDQINFGQVEIIGPTAPNAIQYYEYEILDTLYSGNERLFKIKIQPKNNSRPLMGGELFLIDKKFVVQHIDVILNDQCNFDFYRDIHIIQSYRSFNDSLYLPFHSRRESIFQFNIPGYPELKLLKENFREGYVVNNKKNEFYAGQTKIIYENNLPFEQIPMNPPPLTKAEANGYKSIDSVVTNNPVISLITKSVKLFDLYSELKKKPVGNLSDFYRFNKVEGNFIGAALNTKMIFLPYSIYTGFGYGFQDERIKYFINPEYYFISDFNGLSIGVRVDNKIATREENPELPIWFNTFQSAFKSLDYFDYYYSKGYKIYVNNIFAPFTFKTTFFNVEHKSAKNNISKSLLSDKKFISAINISEGQLIGLRFDIKYSTAGYRYSSFKDELLQNQNYSEFKISYEKGIKSWGSDFNYQKYCLLIFLQQNTYYKGNLDLTVSIGSGSSELPIQKYLELESGFSGYERFKTFQTLNPNSYVGKHKLQFFVEHNFQNSLFRLSQITFIKDIPLDLSLLYNWGWAGNRNWSGLKLNEFYSECGFGIGRIFSVLKTEFLWRIRDVQNSNSFAFSLKLMDLEL